MAEAFDQHHCRANKHCDVENQFELILVEEVGEKMSRQHPESSDGGADKVEGNLLSSQKAHDELDYEAGVDGGVQSIRGPDSRLLRA